MSVAQKQVASPSSSSHSSPSNSLSLIKLDELSSFGATKKGRLPALIKLNNDQQTSCRQVASMPASSAEQLEQVNMASSTQQSSLPANMDTNMQPEDKENEMADKNEELHDFQVIDIGSSELVVGPSLPQPTVTPAQMSEKVAQVTEQVAQVLGSSKRSNSPSNSLSSQNQNQLGDSLINMVVNLRTENQNLVRALETNNEYVKDRINEYRRLIEEAQKRELQFSTERADFEHRNRKLERQNQVLSDRLKSMESKLKELRLEVNTSLAAAQVGSSNSSMVAEEQQVSALYPDLAADLAKVSDPTTMLLETGAAGNTAAGPSAPMETDQLEPEAHCSKQPEAARVAAMSKEELSKRFDAEKVQFYQPDSDYMKLCDQLEKQLNDIGKRDYEICLLQQQLNIYRQDFRLERMANLEAKIQIERLKNDIDRLCLDRLKEQQQHVVPGVEEVPAMARGLHSRRSGSRLVEAAEAGLGKLGQQLSKKAARHAAKAAKHAAKMAHREEKAAHRAASKQQHPSAPTMEAATGDGEPAAAPHQRRQHAGLRGLRTVKSEVVNDLMSTANKAMLTGYRMASTHVNLALDKLSQFEQQQAQYLAQNQAAGATNQAGNLPPGASGLKPSGPPSID